MYLLGLAAVEFDRFRLGIEHCALGVVDGAELLGWSAPVDVGDLLWNTLGKLSLPESGL